MVNKAVEDLARARGGDAAWQAIRRRAGLEIDTFVGLRAYDDEVTTRLVAAAAAEFGLTEDAVLEAFGEHWVRYTAREGWGPLLQAQGTSVAEVLLGLDAMHARIRLAMPELRPPSFTCTVVAPGTLLLDYRSERAGLGPMVVGLVRGLGAVYQTPVEIEHVAGRADGLEHERFKVRLGAA
jgi:hypothetical protein